ncbi:MAG: tRNA (adenosine(37)-N6)-threonylcarbamoyltransferase complex transferase subunit TsaD [Firmicutes bacterium]|nr:tRNA (adenosine(37)-N6)-threonylcarbamoyltransferase complex transferase subunit TsaD [Bacillota bacterium]
MDRLVLGVETSCDETSAAVVAGGRRVLSSVVASQIDVHMRFGGVVPEIASRKHIEAIIPVLDEAVTRAGIDKSEIGGVAATYGPGLVGALLVGLSAAKAIALGIGAPFVCVNHVEGHIYANFIAHPGLEPPVLCLTVSGGHTELILMQAHGEYEVLGRTRDDAAGEAFDKVARVMGLPYPGGPALERLARDGDPEAIEFPRSHVAGSPMDFSFSGLKTAVINYLHRAELRGDEVNLPDVAAAFQKAVVSVLVDRVRLAVVAAGVPRVAVSGGVAANLALRSALEAEGAACGFSVLYPPLELCTDNAAMIASAGFFRLERGIVSPMSANAEPGARLPRSGG